MQIGVGDFRADDRKYRASFDEPEQWVRAPSGNQAASVGPDGVAHEITQNCTYEFPEHGFPATPPELLQLLRSDGLRRFC